MPVLQKSRLFFSTFTPENIPTLKSLSILLFTATVLLPACKQLPQQEKLPDRIVNYDHHIGLDHRNLLDSTFNIPPYTARQISDKPEVVAYWVPRDDERIIFLAEDSLVKIYEGNYDFTAPGPVYTCNGMPFERVDTLHFNPDIYTDLVLYYPANVQGQRFCRVFLGDSTGNFTYRPDIGFTNISMDSATGMVRTYYAGGAADYHFKELYKWADNQLVLVNGAGMRPYNVYGNYELTFYRPRKYSADTIVFRRLYTKNIQPYEDALFKP